MPETSDLLLFAGIFLATLAASLVVAGWILVRLPADYFTGPRRPRGRLVARIAKNALGALVVVAGVLLSLPGVPGQGLLTIFVGLLLLEYPGKYRFERWILARRGVRRTIDRLRTRFGRPPLEG